LNPSVVIPKIIEILKSEFAILADLELDGSSALLSSGLLDSFATVVLLARIETDFKVNIDANTLDIMLFETPATIAQIILEAKYHKARDLPHV
jgi:acyl carrier protein